MIAGVGSLLSIVAIYPLNSAMIPALGRASLLVTVPGEDLLTAVGLAYLVWSAPWTLDTKTAAVRLGAVAGLVFGIAEAAINKSGLDGILFSTPVHMAASGLVGIGLVFAAGRRARGGSDSSVYLGRDTVSLAGVAIGCHLAYDLLAGSIGLGGVLMALGLAGAALLAGIYNYLPEDPSSFPVSEPVELLAGAFAKLTQSAGGAAPAFQAGLVPAPAPTGPIRPAPGAARDCPGCGVALSVDYTFCPGCGSRVATM